MEVPLAIQMEELKQRRDQVTVLMEPLVQVNWDQVVVEFFYFVVVAEEVVTMEAEQDGVRKVAEEDLLTAIRLYVPRQYIQSLLLLVMEWSRYHILLLLR